MSGFEVEALKALPPCHPQLVEAIITQIKSQGLFDDFRKCCLSDIDTKPAYLNLRQRVEGYVNNFLSRQKWSSALQKNQLRETLRKDINESGLLKTGLDHLVDQLIYAHAERSIRPKVKAEIKRYLNLSDVSDQSSAVICIPTFSAVPPHYGPPAMPPLPPVPPPPDVAGAMIESFGNPKPPEPPSPHGSEYSVDMSDSSMVGRDEAPPAIPSRSTIEKPDSNGSTAMGKLPKDAEGRDHENQDQTFNQCSSPEIFEEVSEGGSLGGTPVRDEDALEPIPKVDQTRTDFTGLFNDNKSADGQPISNVSEVIIDEESMAFGILEECVKTEGSMRHDDDRAAVAADDEQLFTQNDDLEVASVTPIMDEPPGDDDNMQISTDDETQCEDEDELAHVKVSTEYQVSQNESAVVEASRLIVPPSEAIEEDCHASLDAELSDTQPPLQIDTEDTEFSVIEKNPCDESQEARVTSEFRNFSETSSHAMNEDEASTVIPPASDENVETSQGRAMELESEQPHSRISESEKSGVNTVEEEGSNSAPDSNVKQAETIHYEDRSVSSSKDSQPEARRRSAHEKSASRSERHRDGSSDRERHRGGRSSTSHGHHSSSISSSSSRSKKMKEHASKSRDKDLDERKARERDGKREKDGRDRGRDRAQADGKSSSSSHSRRKHSRHHQDRRRDGERKTQSSTTSGSHKIDRTKCEEKGSKTDSVKSAAHTGAALGFKSTESVSPLEGSASRRNSFAESSQCDPGPADSRAAAGATLDGEVPSRLLRKSSLHASSLEPKHSAEDDIDLEYEIPFKKRKQRASKQHESTSDRSSVENTGVAKESPTVKIGRRSSAASVTSQQSVETLDQPDSPVPSKFGRQRKINPKYEDDGTLSALLFGKN